MNERSIWLPYETVKSWVQQMGFKSYPQYRDYAKTRVLPQGVPACPRSAYKDDYVSDTDFFGERPDEFVPFDVARIKARRMQFESKAKYQEYCREHEKPKSSMKMPVWPSRIYSEEFVDWADFLGSDRISNAKREFMPYKDALSFIHQLRLTNYYDWYEWANKSGDRPHNIPSNPWDVYSEWNGIKEWIGTNLTARIKTQDYNNAVICFVRDQYDQPNELSYAVFHGGPTQALSKCAQAELDVVAMFKHDSRVSSQVAEIIDRGSSSHYDQKFTAYNIHEIMYELRLILDQA